MRILALILARGGSKRLPGKNIRNLGGKPLIVWSIDVAKNISEICDILVSTDDYKIAEISEKAGAYVPWLRPKELATDAASSADAALHAINWYENIKGPVDGILLLQPTSPFRAKSTIQRGLELFIEYGANTIVGVSLTSDHPMWMLKMDGPYLVPYLSEHGLGSKTQDLPPVFSVNGSFYLITPKELRAEKSFMNGRVIPLKIESPQEALDIDTDWDFRVAEIIAEAGLIYKQ
jgi:CMP-N-acetylneuraminic acid synthetase